MPTIELTPKGMKRFRGGHPWVFRSDIARTDPSAKPGQVVEILSPQGAFCGEGFYNPHSQITVRLLSYEREPVDEAFLPPGSKLHGRTGWLLPTLIVADWCMRRLILYRGLF